MTECLRLEVEMAGHGNHIHVQAVLPGAVASNIFESAGDVDSSGDATTAEAQRSAMLTVKAGAVTAGCDPIRDWGERYAARLRDAGVQTTLTRYPGMYHGFLMRSEATARGQLAIAEIGGLLRAKFANPLRF